MTVAGLFESELRRRGFDFRMDESARYEVSVRDRRLLVNVDNLRRELAGDGRTLTESPIL